MSQHPNVIPLDTKKKRKKREEHNIVASMHPSSSTPGNASQSQSQSQPSHPNEQKYYFQQPGKTTRSGRQELDLSKIQKPPKPKPKPKPPINPATMPWPPPTNTHTHGDGVHTHDYHAATLPDDNWHGMGDRPAFQSKNQGDYIKEFIDHVGEAIPAYIHHEYLHPDNQICGHCKDDTTTNFAIWRCRDCFVPHALCRGCIRKQHLHNPFHKIECWTGNHFRRAALWEVGLYVVAPHQDLQNLCGSLKNMVAVEEQKQRTIDEEQQKEIAIHVFPIGFPMDGVSESGHISCNQASLKGKQREVQQEDYERTEAQEQADEDQEGINDTEDGMEVDVTLEAEIHADIEFDKKMEQAYRAHGLKNYIRPEEFLYQHAAAFEGQQASKVEVIDPDVRQPSGLMRVAHTNGYHRINFLRCSCQGESKTFGDFVAAGFMPASFSQVNTLFTRQLLDFARLANLELAASVYQIHQLLVRQTQPLGYILADDLYHLLRRMLRLDRWMKKLKWAGFGHLTQDPLKPAAGQLSNFCAACPQPGINLPADWKSDKNQVVYSRSFVADGNFKADHISAATRADETPLYDGGGMMPHSDAYKNHIEKATETRMKAPCENTFRAIEASLTASKVCDVTGVVGIACARHGIYCPNGLVDLYKGEQQKNVDYAFVQALVRTNVDVKQRVTILYDIACQYSIHLRARIDGMLAEHGLELLEIDRAIGLFHIHAHKDKCYFRYSPSFIPGLGIVDGEIMETNWSVLNKHSRALRTGHQVGRVEGLDDYTSDLNYKRTLQMPETLRKKYSLAKTMSAEHKLVFAEVSQKCHQHVQAWTAAIEEAESKRLEEPAVMDIYGADSNKMKLSPPAALPASASSDLQEYLNFAFIVEDAQSQVVEIAQRATKDNTGVEAEKLEAEREKLRTMLGKLQILEAKGGVLYEAAPADLPPPSVTDGLPEHKTLFLPSNKNVNAQQTSVECACRVQHLQSLLKGIRDLVVERSLKFSHVMQNKPSSGVKTRSQAKTQQLETRVKVMAQLYRNSRNKLLKLNPDHHTLHIFQELNDKDVQASSLMVSGNSTSSRGISKALSWIWRSRLLARAPDQLGQEDRNSLDSVATEEFLRVHWLRARALCQRWEEEVELVTHEMAWVVRYFLYRAEGWKRAALDPKTSKPASCYAYRQQHACLRIATHADMIFKTVNSQYQSPM
ncbi:hypothetical protein BJ165DRAFT_1411233 [Panaeolus papilionaceus]|nr:hypothetical protein BJ165DRAFT_1411233 [Panaeolus papilionaceus]